MDTLFDGTADETPTSDAACEAIRVCTCNDAYSLTQTIRDPIAGTVKCLRCRGIRRGAKDEKAGPDYKHRTHRKRGRGNG